MGKADLFVSEGSTLFSMKCALSLLVVSLVAVAVTGHGDGWGYGHHGHGHGHHGHGHHGYHHEEWKPKKRLLRRPPVCMDGMDAVCDRRGNAYDLTTCTCTDGSTPARRSPCDNGDDPICTGGCPDGTNPQFADATIPVCPGSGRLDTHSCRCADRTPLRRPKFSYKHPKGHYPSHKPHHFGPYYGGYGGYGHHYGGYGHHYGGYGHHHYEPYYGYDSGY